MPFNSSSKVLVHKHLAFKYILQRQSKVSFIGVRACMHVRLCVSICLSVCLSSHPTPIPHSTELLQIESSVFHMLDKPSPTELHCSPKFSPLFYFSILYSTSFRLKTFLCHPLGFEPAGGVYCCQLGPMCSCLCLFIASFKIPVTPIIRGASIIFIASITPFPALFYRCIRVLF